MCDVFLSPISPMLHALDDILARGPPKKGGGEGVFTSQPNMDLSLIEGGLRLVIDITIR